MEILAEEAFLTRARQRRRAARAEVEAAVRPLLEEVRGGGDRALCELAARLDGAPLTPERLAVAPSEFDAAEAAVSGAFRTALAAAIAHVTAYHEAEPRADWWVQRPDGSRLGQMLKPVRRAGLYVPGGTAPLVSTLVMLAVPARVAGVRELVVCTPPRPDGSVDPHVLAAARALGVGRVFRAGGAQAIAALAYGTEQVPAVDLIAGPGNAYVTAAKRLVAGDVGIDGLMGPTEVAVLAADPETGGDVPPADWVAADLLSQAEHDPLAACYLVSTSAAYAEAVLTCLSRQLADLPRAAIARQSVERWGAACVVPTLERGIALLDELAPEHLQILAPAALELARLVRCAGAIFCGPWSPEAAGDYAAGPSHVLPTSGAARYASAVSAATFLRRTSVIALSRAGFAQLADAVEVLAAVEGLHGHARSIRIRRAAR